MPSNRAHGPADYVAADFERREGTPIRGRRERETVYVLPAGALTLLGAPRVG